MSNILAILISWQFLLFSIGVFAIIYILRTILETAFPSITTNRIWEKAILPISPFVIGCVIALIAKNYAYPDNLSSELERFFFGLIAGMFSGTSYQIVKGLLKKEIGN
jgi:hypothetical protein